MTAVKICGLTRSEDVEAAAEFGAALLGFNFASASPRRVSIERARVLAAAAPPAALRVGVFARESRDVIARAVGQTPLDMVQLHRPVTEDDLEWCPVPVIAAVLPGQPPDPEVLARLSALLWDSSAGTGTLADWDVVAACRGLEVRQFLAGGLDPDNVAEAVRRIRPDGVDVASGVESAPGVKDRYLLARFFAAVREADRGAA